MTLTGLSSRNGYARNFGSNGTSGSALQKRRSQRNSPARRSFGAPFSLPTSRSFARTCSLTARLRSVPLRLALLPPLLLRLPPPPLDPDAGGAGGGGAGGRAAAAAIAASTVQVLLYTEEHERDGLQG